jgi:hypothetical protein
VVVCFAASALGQAGRLPGGFIFPVSRTDPRLRDRRDSFVSIGCISKSSDGELRVTDWRGGERPSVCGSNCNLATTAIPAVIMHGIIASVAFAQKALPGPLTDAPVLPLARKTESREPPIALAARIRWRERIRAPRPPVREVDKKAGSRVRPVERNPTHRIERYGGCRVPNIAAKCRRLLQSGGRRQLTCSLKSANKRSREPAGRRGSRWSLPNRRRAIHDKAAHALVAPIGISSCAQVIWASSTG